MSRNNRERQHQPRARKRGDTLQHQRELERKNSLKRIYESQLAKKETTTDEKTEADKVSMDD